MNVIPSDPAAAAREFPWITFEGRWGELQKAFFNGPTGPNLKEQWTEPIAWSSGWRAALRGPTGGVLGTSATDFFCSAVATGSRGLVGLLRSPGLTLLVLAGLLALRSSERPGRRGVPPRRTASPGGGPGARPCRPPAHYVQRPSLFLGIGVLLIPLGVVIAAVQALVLGGFGLAGVDTTGESAGALVLLVTAIGTTSRCSGSHSSRPRRPARSRARRRAPDRPDAGLPAGAR